MLARLLVALLAAAVLAPAATAAPAPQDLRAFLLRADERERPTRTFARTPAFAWNGVAGAERYEFELSTARSFADNAIVWEDREIRAPLATVPLTLPWISGARYSWYARVRAVVGGEEGPWSAPYGFNMRAGSAPRSLSNGVNPQPGMVRWTPVEGATAYEVVLLYEPGQAKNKQIRTAATAVDLREYYTFHTSFPSSVHWRVRAVRELEGAPRNSLPVASYGPWSAPNRTIEPAFDTTVPLALRGSISRRGAADVTGTSSGPGAHELTPAFWWSGARSPDPDRYGACPFPVAEALGDLADAACPLFRVYVYSDADCVNVVHVSDLVGSPAYVPRLSGPLELPTATTGLVEATNLYLGDGETEAPAFDAGGHAVVATGAKAAGADDAADAGEAEEEGPRRNGFWDVDWSTGRYYWVVVPVVPYLTTDDKVEYRDVLFGQDACAAGNVMTFGKTSAAATASEAGVPFASGVGPSGRVVGAQGGAPAFFGHPLVAWKPAPGAQRYELQWSRRSYPWRTEGSVTTPATTALLDLPVGRWFYRVRGLDATLPGPPGLTWSEAAELQIVPRTFSVVKLKRARR